MRTHDPHTRSSTADETDSSTVTPRVDTYQIHAFASKLEKFMLQNAPQVRWPMFWRGPAGRTDSDPAELLRPRLTELRAALRAELRAELVSVLADVVRAKCSVWRVRYIESGNGIVLSDVISADERFVHERRGLHTLAIDGALLARVAEHRGISFLAAVHPAQLEPAVTERLSRDAWPAPLTSLARRATDAATPTRGDEMWTAWARLVAGIGGEPGAVREVAAIARPPSLRGP